MNGRIALISLGSNAAAVHAAPASLVLNGSRRIAALLDPAARCSRSFTTPAFPPGLGPDFVNAAMAVRTDLAPQAVLGILHAIEDEAARTRDTRWGPRTLDLDLLAVGDLIAPDRSTFDHWRTLSPQDQRRAWPDRLILPHPRLQDRAFVLVPLRDVAPDWVHPVLSRSVAQMCAALPPEDVAGITPMDAAAPM